MAESSLSPVVNQVLVEQNQGHETRKGLFVALEKGLDRPVVSFFTSFNYPVMIENDDAEMLQGVLEKMDLSKGLALMVSSPGGDGLAAERIIKVCRSFSGTGDYWVLVPGMAKSAATMICFGAARILMGVTAELGPVDPQVTTVSESGQIQRFSVFNIVHSYEELFGRAIREQGRLEPYLQQLSRYDEREIKEYRVALQLSEDIAVRALANGMMRGRSKNAIRKRIKTFLTPEKTMHHGRPIHLEEAEKCGLKLEAVAAGSKLWGPMYELYVRTNQYVKGRVAKCIESRDVSFWVAPPKR